MKISKFLDKREDILIPKFININSTEKDFFSLFKNYIPDRTLIAQFFIQIKQKKKQLSTKGTEIDVMTLILYVLRPIHETKIYLENKGGLVRNYSITVIIDNSKSCFDE